MRIWSMVVGAFGGTLVLTTALTAASELGMTRMDLPFLLGTAFTADRTRARTLGYGLHFAVGLGFALFYYAVFVTLDSSGWVLGAMLGLIHALFAGTVLVNQLLPLVHPRMATFFSAANTAPLLEPPGFMMLNYGRSTPVVMVLAHIAYGAIVGGFVQLAR